MGIIQDCNCDTWTIPRNDKYSSKVFKYFVEYSETETTKNTHTEKETRSSTTEAGRKHACKMNTSIVWEFHVYIHIYMPIMLLTGFVRVKKWHFPRPAGMLPKWLWQMKLQSFILPKHLRKVTLGYIFMVVIWLF